MKYTDRYSKKSKKNNPHSSNFKTTMKLCKKANTKAFNSQLTYIKWFNELGCKDVAMVGGKNSSLGELFCNLTKKGIKVPNGFATTAKAYVDFLNFNHLSEEIEKEIKTHHTLKNSGEKIRSLILKAKLPPTLIENLIVAYRKLSRYYNCKNVDVAVRSSATAEDLPQASFAGQQESYLNISDEKNLLEACIKCYASLFTDRAITYREEQGFDHLSIALSIGIQKMVRSDLAGSGVMFSIDTETGFKNCIVINAGLGLGENVVQGTISPDEYEVFKPLVNQNHLIPIIEKRLGQKEKKMIYTKNKNHPTKNIATTPKEAQAYVLKDQEILTLAKWACTIENHYKKPMDMEWAKDGRTKELFIVQARPETVQSRKQPSAFKTFCLTEKGKIILEGLAVGEAIISGRAQVIKNVKEISKFKKGSILITPNTSPDWVPIMKKAAGIITDHGGRTSHAAIVSRELGVPAIVGANIATKIIKTGQNITLSCCGGEKGIIYDGLLKYDEKALDLDTLPKTRTQLMINLASPDGAFHWWPLPVKGVGLARMEFIINDIIKIHPMALVNYDKIKDRKVKNEINKLTFKYKNKEDYFIERLALSLSRIAASQYPHPVIVRMSDFKTNEYANLIGGYLFEPHEENPMIGFRGASRYYNEKYRAGFKLECLAIKMAREIIGLNNIIIMIPFCRTLNEADKVLQELSNNGLKRAENDLQIYVMCEIPSNVLLADEFADRFDGFSIGSNDLTQLTLGVDRDSEELSEIFDERNEAVKKLISRVIKIAHQKHCKVGICGQAPSDYPEFTNFLIKEGIDSISLNPDSVIQAIHTVANAEKQLTKAILLPLKLKEMGKSTHRPIRLR
jgi:pyruvate,water dikinase